MMTGLCKLVINYLSIPYQVTEILDIQKIYKNVICWIRYMTVINISRTIERIPLRVALENHTDVVIYTDPSCNEPRDIIAIYIFTSDAGNLFNCTNSFRECTIVVNRDIFYILRRK